MKFGGILWYRAQPDTASTASSFWHVSKDATLEFQEPFRADQSTSTGSSRQGTPRIDHRMYPLVIQQNYGQPLCLLDKYGSKSTINIINGQFSIAMSAMLAMLVYQRVPSRHLIHGRLH